MVAYALKITDLDPLKYDLLFERFLNPERISMPDFDVDFCIEGRDRVIQHVSDLYGKESVAQIITFGTMAAKAVVRDVARVQGHPYALADKLSKLIPFVPGMTLQKALDSTPELRQFIEEDLDAQEIMEMAFALEGLTRNVGKHAGGVVIAQTKLTDFSPLYCDPNSESVVTQFDKDDAETVGLVKFDFLGLRTLTIIDNTLKMINSSKGEPRVILENLPLDDARVYELLQRGETTAVFQLESRGMKDLIKRQMPNCFADVIALVALFRPGPLESGMVDDFIDRKHGRTQVVFPHPELEPVLADTYGVILYQEQVMKIAQVLGNYTLGAADILRKAMGKKDPEEMARQRSLFTEGAVKRGVDKKLAESIFDLMEHFAGYGFNKSHSAAYALVSYQTAWLKTHYPAYFMAAVLSAEMQNTDKIVTLIDECNALGIAIIPPDVNLGEFLFTVNEEGEIVYGLGAIRGLGEGPVNAILDSRSQGPYASMLDICLRVDSQQLNRRTLEALVNAGALDNLVEGSVDYSRAALADLLPKAMQAAAQENRNLASGVRDLFGEIVPEGTSNCEQATDHLDIKEWDEQARLRAEKDALGLYLSGHPIDAFLPELRVITAGRLKDLRPDRGTKFIGGLLTSLRTGRSKSGETITFLTIDDRSARVEISLFSKEHELFRDQLRVDEIFIIECSISIDERSGGVKGRAKAVMTLSEARCSRANRILLHLDESELKPNFCDDLAETLEPYRLQRAFGTFQTDSKQRSGNAEEGCRVAVNYLREASKGCIMLGHEWSVLPSDDLIQNLRRNYGHENVLVEY
jgi:DNA polymerase-3 subunit alpha